MEIRTSLDLPAPPDRVWELLVDFAGYDRWNPLLKRMRGRCEVGATVRFHLGVAPVPLPISAEIVVVEPGRELVWIGPAMRWLRRAVTGEHYFRLTAIPGGTRFDHGETFSGALIPARSALLESRIEPGYAAMNRAMARTLAS